MSVCRYVIFNKNRSRMSENDLGLAPSYNRAVGCTHFGTIPQCVKLVFILTWTEDEFRPSKTCRYSKKHPKYNIEKFALKRTAIT